jgi:hypothetical protein
MISFRCKQCGKALERPREAAGSLVFCECGQGTRVPWESTDPPLASLAEEEADAAALPAAIPVGGERAADLGRARHPRALPHRDPHRCFNHPEAEADQTCAACGLGFCAACVVRWRGETLCGPCKNFMLAWLQRPPRLSVLALSAVIASVLTSPVGFCLTLMTATMKAPVFVAVCVSAIPPLLSLVLGGAALRQVENNPNLTGRSLALTAVVAAAVSVILIAIFAILIQRGVGGLV